MTSRAVRSIIVTGASAGLGRSLAQTYAGPGVMLGLVGRDARRLEETAVACRARGAEVVTASLDVRDSSTLAEWLRQFDHIHPIDLLIANAGIASTIASASDWEGQEKIASIVDTNFYGVVHAVLPVVERMRERSRGHVAMVSSIAALRGMAISPAYCASKAAIKAYGDSIRPLLARDGISVSIILPGFIKTAMSDVFPGSKRFMWTADRAAAYIRRKLDVERAEIAFPGPLVFGMRLLPLLPAVIADAILARLSYVPRKVDSN